MSSSSNFVKKFWSSPPRKCKRICSQSGGWSKSPRFGFSLDARILRAVDLPVPLTRNSFYDDKKQRHQKCNKTIWSHEPENLARSRQRKSVEFERIGTESMRRFLFQRLWQIYNLNRLKRTFFYADTTPNAKGFWYVCHFVTGLDFDTKFPHAYNGALPLALLSALFRLALRKYNGEGSAWRRKVSESETSQQYHNNTNRQNTPCRHRSQRYA